MHQVGTSSLLIYMMHGHTYIKLVHICCVQPFRVQRAAFFFLSVHFTQIIVSCFYTCTFLIYLQEECVDPCLITLANLCRVLLKIIQISGLLISSVTDNKEYCLQCYRMNIIDLCWRSCVWVIKKNWHEYTRCEMPAF